MEWIHRASRAMRKAKKEGSRLWPLYRARCADLRAARKLARAKDADLAAIKEENEALQSRAVAAEKKLQELKDLTKAWKEGGNHDACEYFTRQEESERR